MRLAKQQGMSTMAITDINTTSACLDVVRMAPKYNIKPVVGVDFRNGVRQQFIALAKNNAGFLAINNYLSSFLHQKEFHIPERAKVLENTFIIYPFSTFKGEVLKAHEFLGVTLDDLNRLQLSPWRKRLEKLVLLHTVSFQDKKGFNTHRLLRAIANNTLLSKLPVSEQGSSTHCMPTATALAKASSAIPSLLANTIKLLEQCRITFDFTQMTPQNQKSYTAREALDYRLLKKLTYDGIAYRYQTPDKTILARIEKELNVIKDKGFVSYFLINWKILKYARSKGYFYVGRGSGANSIIAYLLRITDVDPVELDLYFERFINLYRKIRPILILIFLGPIAMILFNSFLNGLSIQH